MKFNSEKGQALILIAFGIVALIGFTALTIDGGRAFSDRRHAQNAADTAALAAALANTKGENFTTAGQDRATSNGYDDNGTTNDVSITAVNTASGICPAAGKEITVTIVSHVPATFARVLGRSEIVNTVKAIARSCDLAPSKPLYVGTSIYSTKKGACNGSNAASLYMNGSGHLQVWGGDMGSASTDPGCLRFQGGQTELKKQESGTACADIVTSALSGGIFNNVQGNDGCGAKIYGQSFENPPADLGITCSGNATVSGTIMSPGNFTGTFPGNSVKTLEPGTYCINGDFSLNGGQKLTGNGVTIVMKNGTLKWNGSSEVNLSAPTVGNYKGLLIYAPPSNSYANSNNEINIDGGANAKISGTILAQNLPCYFAGSGQIQKAVIQFICYTWGMNGNGQGEIMYDSSKFYAPIVYPTISLLQ